MDKTSFQDYESKHYVKEDTVFFSIDPEARARVVFITVKLEDFPDIDVYRHNTGRYNPHPQDVYILGHNNVYGQRFISFIYSTYVKHLGLKKGDIVQTGELEDNIEYFIFDGTKLLLSSESFGYKLSSDFPVLVSANSPDVYPINYWDDAMVSIGILQKFNVIQRSSFTIAFDHQYFLKEIIKNLSSEEIFGQLSFENEHGEIVPVKYLHTRFQVMNEQYEQLTDRGFKLEDKRFLLPELNKIIAEYTTGEVHIIILLTKDESEYKEGDVKRITEVLEETDSYSLPFRSTNFFQWQKTIRGLDEDTLEKYKNRLMFLNDGEIVNPV